MSARLRFAPTAVLYTIAYAAAVAADHLSTLAAARAGGVETNVLFQSDSGGLAEARAMLVFVLLWPVMLLLLWIADQRASGRQAEPGWIVRQLVGRTAWMAALLPFVVVVAKTVAGAANMVIPATGHSIYTPVRNMLDRVGITAWDVQSVICGLVVLLPSIWLSAVMAKWFYGDPIAEAKPLSEEADQLDHR